MAFNLAWYDAVGTLGVILILLAYFLLQTGRWASHALNYLIVNLVGSFLIAISLLYDFNLSAFLIEIAWIAISLYGVVRHHGPGRAQAHAP